MVWDVRCRVSGVVFMNQGVWCMVHGVWCYLKPWLIEVPWRISGFRVLGSRLRSQNSGFRVQGPGLGVEVPLHPERESFIDNLLVRIHFIMVMIRWTGLSPCEFEIPFPGRRTSTCLEAIQKSNPFPVSAEAAVFMCEMPLFEIN